MPFLSVILIPSILDVLDCSLNTTLSPLDRLLRNSFLWVARLSCLLCTPRRQLVGCLVTGFHEWRDCEKINLTMESGEHVNRFPDGAP